ncbi:MAG: TIGR00296 family protein [Thermoplasmata archaeon]
MSGAGSEEAFRGPRAFALVLSTEEGVAAVRLARRAIDGALGPHRPDSDPAEVAANEPQPPVFDEPRGVFVTLKRYPDDALRGCIGYPLPVLPLRTALARAAVSAAIEDYRFRPVRASDLPRLTVEVSVLSVPSPIPFTTPEEMIRAVTVGRDGLIVEGLGSSGLLLPQVAPEQGWSAEELLDGTCEKAGLPTRAWRDSQVKVRRFEAEIFREVAPGGDVVRADPTVATADGPPARKR